MVLVVFLAGEALVLVLAARHAISTRGQGLRHRLWAVRWWLYLGLCVAWMSLVLQVWIENRDEPGLLAGAVIFLMLPGFVALVLRSLGVVRARVVSARSASRAVTRSSVTASQVLPTASASLQTAPPADERVEAASTTSGAAGSLLRHFLHFFLSPADSRANLWGQSMDGSSCKFCGSTSFGTGCPYSPHGSHEHRGRRRRRT